MGCVNFSREGYVDLEHVSYTVTHGVVVREMGIFFPAALAHEEREFSAFCSSEVA